MLELQEQLDDFIVNLKETEVYREFEEQKRRLCEQPELKQRVDDFRRRNYEIQTRAYQENIFDDILEAWFYNYQTVAIMLILFGIAFIIIENKHQGKRARVRRLQGIDYRLAFWIGMFQLIAAIFPGTSRSGATIVGALLLGVSRTVAAEYTFFLAIPVMFGASLLKGAKFLMESTLAQGEGVILLVGMVVAFVVSLFVIKFLMGYIKKHDFKVFGWYRIVLGIIVLVCGFVGVI